MKAIKIFGSNAAVELLHMVFNGIIEPFKPLERKNAVSVSKDKVFIIFEVEEYNDGLAVVLVWNNGERQVYAISEKLLNSYYSYSILTTIGYMSHFVGVNPITNTDTYIIEFKRDSNKSNAFKTLIKLSHLVIEEQNFRMLAESDQSASIDFKPIEILAFQITRIHKPIAETDVLKNWD
jgi:hypothetical protein